MATEPTTYDACGVCGRTILRGERVVAYVSPDGERAMVCELCKPAAEAGGWVPAHLAGNVAGAGKARRRGLGVRDRLGRASSAVKEAAKREALRHTSTAQPRRRQAPAPDPPAGAGNAGPEESSPQHRVRAALESFNASRETRKVAGLIRSLGEPQVAVRADGEGAGRVVVTVAWELSWYQWEVTADGGAGVVRELRKGDEMSELPESERGWNASAEADGTLRMQAAAPRTGAARD